MKKLLSILAAMGLTATAGASVVACGSNDTKKNDDNGNNPKPSNRDLKLDLAEAETDAKITLSVSGKLVESIKTNDFTLDGTDAKITTVEATEDKTIVVSLDKAIDKNDKATITWTIPGSKTDVLTDKLPESKLPATNKNVKIASASVSKENFKVVELKTLSPLSKEATNDDFALLNTEATIAYVKGDVDSNTITLTLAAPVQKTDKVSIKLTGYATSDIQIDTSNIPEPAKAAPQSFMAGNIPSVSFDEAPTQEQLAKDFEVKVDGKPVEGVIYSFKADEKKTYSFAQGITGSVTYKIPVKEDAPVKKMPKPQPTPEAAKTNKSLKEACEKAEPPVAFKVDSINLSGIGSMSKIHEGKNDEVDFCSYVSKDNVKKAIASDSNLAKDVYTALFGKKSVEDDDYAKALFNKWDDVSLEAATGMDINQDNVNKAFDATNGRSIPVYEVFPGNYIYQLGLKTNDSYFWMNLGFNKIVSNVTPKKSVISDIQVQLPYGVQAEYEDGRHLTAKVTNMNDIAGCGDGTMKGMPVIYSHLRLGVSHDGGNTWNYVRYSDLSIGGRNDQIPTDDNGESLSTWNEQDSLSWRSAFKMDGTLDLHWGNSWKVNEGDKIKIEYTDLTGTQVTSGEVEVKRTPINAQSISLTGISNSTIYMPYGDTNNGHHAVKSDSFVDKESIIKALTKDENTAKIAEKNVFSFKHDNQKTYVQELIEHKNEISIKAAKGLMLNSQNINSENKDATFVTLNEVMPGLADYQIELTNGNNHYWFNLDFKKKLDGKLAQAKLTDNKVNIAYSDKGDLSLNVANMDDIAGYDELPVIFTNMKVSIHRSWYTADQTIYYTNYSAYGQDLPEGTKVSPFDNNGIGLRSVFTKDGRLELHWGKGFNPVWNNEEWLWYLNKDEIGTIVKVEFTDLTGTRQLITIDVHNGTATMDLAK